jgi:uncharacterized membrane protein
MKSIPRLLLTGLLTVLPIVVTIAILAWLGGMLESMLGGLLAWLLPDGAYITGMGLVAGVVLVVVVGIMMSTWLAQRLVEKLEQIMARVPMVNALYGAIKDMTSMFSPGRQRDFSAVVTFKLPGSDARIMGFVTRDDCSDLPGTLGREDMVAVYMPMSYQIGGYTLLLPREQLEAVDMPTSDALRFTLTAGVTGGPQNPG